MVLLKGVPIRYCIYGDLVLFLNMDTCKCNEFFFSRIRALCILSTALFRELLLLQPPGSTAINVQTSIKFNKPSLFPRKPFSARCAGWEFQSPAILPSAPFAQICLPPPRTLLQEVGRAQASSLSSAYVTAESYVGNNYTVLH